MLCNVRKWQQHGVSLSFPSAINWTPDSLWSLSHKFALRIIRISCLRWWCPDFSLHCITLCIIVFSHENYNVIVFNQFWRTDFLFRKQLSVFLWLTSMVPKWSKILTKVDCLKIPLSSTKRLIQQSTMSMVNLQEITTRVFLMIQVVIEAWLWQKYSIMHASGVALYPAFLSLYVMYVSGLSFTVCYVCYVNALLGKK